VDRYTRSLNTAVFAVLSFEDLISWGSDSVPSGKQLPFFRYIEMPLPSGINSLAGLTKA